MVRMLTMPAISTATIDSPPGLVLPPPDSAAHANTAGRCPPLFFRSAGSRYRSPNSTPCASTSRREVIPSFARTADT